MSIRSRLAGLCAKLPYRSEAVDALSIANRAPSLQVACCLHSCSSKGRPWCALPLLSLAEHGQELQSSHLLLFRERPTCAPLITISGPTNLVTILLQTHLWPVHQYRKQLHTDPVSGCSSPYFSLYTSA